MYVLKETLQISSFKTHPLTVLAASVDDKTPTDHGTDDRNGASAVRVLRSQVGRLFVASCLIGSVPATEPPDATLRHQSASVGLGSREGRARKEAVGGNDDGSEMHAREVHDGRGFLK